MNKKGNSEEELPKKGWKDYLQELIDKYNPFRKNKEVASDKTQRERANFLYKMFRDLHEMNHGVLPQNLKEKHIKLMCKKFEADGLKPATIQGYICFMREFCNWIGKHGMMKETKSYFTSQDCITRTYQATRDKSWEGNGIDKEDVFRQIRNDVPEVWMQMLLVDAFGLRLKEVVTLRPYLADRDGYLHVVGKGGRPRAIKIEDEYQREVIDMAKEMVGKSTRYLGKYNNTLKQNHKKISNTMSKYQITKSGKGALGVTLHGLRSGFAMRKLGVKGVEQIFRKGKPAYLSKEEDLEARQRLSNDLGHNRIAVVNAYVPPNSKNSRAKIKHAQTEAVLEWLPKLKKGDRYKLGLILSQDTEETVVPDIFVEITFIQVCLENDEWFFHVQEENHFEGNLIPVHHIVSIYHL